MDAPTANTSLGPVTGRWLANGVAEYLGLQYATAERWAAPQSRSSPYSSTDGLEFGPNCPQLDGQVYNASDADEECLYVQGCWRPPRKAQPSPVLVWIHGGGLAFGGGSAFNGSHLAAKQGVLVCTINYRLGFLGWLALPEDSARGTGNWGLLDQQEALRWVRREIGAFGGDPTAVTIFGQSAGAASVIRHLVSPASRGLFDRAISESGTTHVWSRAFAVHKANLAGARLGCTVASRACLRHRTVAEILEAQGPSATPGIHDEQVLAVIDGVSLVAPTLDVLRSGGAARVPLLLGGNTNDSNLFVFGFAEFANLTDATYLQTLNRTLYVDGHAAPAPRRLQQILEHYPPTGTPKGNQRAFAEYATDKYFLCGTRAVAAAAAMSSAKVRTFLYRFDHAYGQPACADLLFGPQFGVTHTAEISFVFGQPTYVFGRPTHPERCAFNSTEQRFADSVGELWAGFARSGMPAHPQQWPAYSTATDVNALLSSPDATGLEKHWRRRECAGWRS